MYLMWNKLIKYDKIFGAQNYKPLSVILNRGKGVFLYDINNKKYFDFLSSYSSVNQGHCHPKLVKKMQEQCSKLTLCSRAFYNENLCNFYKYMNQTFGYDKCLPMNTGVEAGETAIKLARLWGYKVKNVPENKAEIIVAKNNFWGRSIAACSSSNDSTCYNNFGPFTPGFKFVEYNNINKLEDLFIKNKNIVAYMMEPIQGEAGIIIPDKNYLFQVKKLCQDYNILLICDEVQTGIGRTGKMLVSEDVKPDLVVLGKALSGGMMPVSCVLGNNEIIDLMKPGMHGSTYGGNPLGTALVPEAINIIKEEELLENSIKQGNYFREELSSFINKGKLKDVRGVGLLNAIEFYDSKTADKAVNMMMHNGLLTKVTKNGTVRMCPPLVINEKEMNDSLKIIKNVVDNI